MSAFHTFSHIVPDEELKNLLRNLSNFDEDRSPTMGGKRLVFDSFSVEV